MQRIYQILTVLMVLMAVAFAVGWIQKVPTGQLSTTQYIHMFWYDLTHLYETPFFRKIYEFVLALTQ